MLADKRRVLRDEEAKFHEIERRIRDKQFQERTLAERLKNEYDDLRQRFEQMAFELRFSIEDELKIYARLLDELMKKSSSNAVSYSSSTTSGGGGMQQTTGTKSTTISSVIRSSGIEDRDNTTSYQQNYSSSSNTGLGSTASFDLGGGNTTWTSSGITGNDGGFRTGEHQTNSSMTRTSSYSQLN